MSRARKTTYLYTVTMSTYASEEIKAQYERGERFTAVPSHFITDMLYMGTSETRAGAAFYRGVKKAMGNPLARHVTVWSEGKAIARANIDD